MRDVPASLTAAAALPFFPLPPVAGLRGFLTPFAGVAARLRGVLAGVAEELALLEMVAVDLAGALYSASLWAILRSFFRCSCTARGVQVMVSVVS